MCITGTNIYLQAELTALAPELAKKSAETEELMKKLTVDQEQANEVRAVVVKEEAIANKKAEETKAIAADAQKDLDQALPALQAANKVSSILASNLGVYYRGYITEVYCQIVTAGLVS